MLNKVKDLKINESQVRMELCIDPKYRLNQRSVRMKGNVFRDKKQKRNDERGTRTPGMRSITGLAIPRHTGLGYLVTKDFKKRVPLNAFYVFNLFQGKGFT